MHHHKSGQLVARASRGSGGMLPKKILKIGSLKTPFSALSGRNMWQNSTESCDVFPLTFTYKCGYQVIAPILPPRLRQLKNCNRVNKK